MNIDIVQDSVFKRKTSTNLNTENDSYKIFKNIFQRKMLKQTKKGFSITTEYLKDALEHDEDLYPFS